MGYFKRLKPSWSVSMEAFKMYYVMRASAPSLHRESTDSLMTELAVPSAAPTSVSVSEVTSSSITIQWGAVDCIHQNGDITSYSVQYNEVGSEIIRSLTVSQDEVTITGLSSSTNYSIEVAAVNTAGTGVFSEDITNQTKESQSKLLIPLLPFGS